MHFIDSDVLKCDDIRLKCLFNELDLHLYTLALSSDKENFINSSIRIHETISQISHEFYCKLLEMEREIYDQ